MRLAHLDALRGLAAISVAIFHFKLAFPSASLAMPVLDSTAFGALLNGHFAVEAFFALSGYLFMFKFLGASSGDAARAVVKRYLRLTLPVLGASLIAWILFCAGAFANQEAAPKAGSAWLADWYKFEPSLWLAFYEPLLGMYIGIDPASTYNISLWTIIYELFAVAGVIGLAVVMPRLAAPWRVLVMVCAAALTWETYAFAFILGASVALVRKTRDTQLSSLACFAIGFLGLSLGAIAGPAAAFPRIAWPAGAVLLLIAIDSGPAVRKAMSARWLAWLGSLSFGIYVMHFLTVNSVAARVYLWTNSVGAAFAAYLPATLLAAVAFRELLDEPSQKMLARFMPLQSALRRNAVLGSAREKAPSGRA
jgi:peptidoglycan/LPS O-acetylase OafA/YrhL